MFEVNGTLVIFIVSFAIFMLALNEVMLKPVGRIIEERKKRIDDDVAQGKASRAQAEEITAGYQKKLHEIRTEAQKQINDAIGEAQKKRDGEVNKIKEEGRKKLEGFKQELSRERASLIDGLVDQEIDLVKTITAKVSGAPISMNVDRESVKRQLGEVS